MNNGIPLCSGTYLYETGIVEHNEFLVFLFVIGNSLTFLSYMLIPFMVSKLKNRPNIPVVVKHTLSLFVVFILVCGVGHAMKATGTLHTVFNFFDIGIYYFYLESSIDVATGLVSFYTVIQLLRNGIYFMELPTKAELGAKADEIKRLKVRIEYLQDD